MPGNPLLPRDSSMVWIWRSKTNIHSARSFTPVKNHPAGGRHISLWGNPPQSRKEGTTRTQSGNSAPPGDSWAISTLPPVSRFSAPTRFRPRGKIHQGCVLAATRVRIATIRPPAQIARQGRFKSPGNDHPQSRGTAVHARLRLPAEKKISSSAAAPVLVFIKTKIFLFGFQKETRSFRAQNTVGGQDLFS